MTTIKTVDSQGKIDTEKGKEHLTWRKGHGHCFWNAAGISLAEYLEKNGTINAKYYADLLDQLKGKIKKKVQV